MKWLAGTLVVVALVAAGCGKPGSEQERREILETVESGRDALVAGRAKEACALLTEDGRRRSLEYIPYDQGRDCESTVRRLVKEARHPAVLEDWIDVAPRAKFEVTEIDDDRAKVRVDADDDTIHIELRRTPDGWRIDNSDDVPQGD